MAKLFISDLDETLLVDGKLTLKTRESLKVILGRKENQFSVASARNIHSVKEAMAGVGLRLPVITYGGSYISDVVKGEHLYTFSIECESVFSILSFLHEASVDPFLYAHNLETCTDTIYFHSLTNNSMEWCLSSDSYFKDQYFCHYSNVDELSKSSIVRMILKGRSKEILAIQDELTARFIDKVNIFTYPSWYLDGNHWLIVVSKHANKLNAIMKLLQICNREITELIYYGDSLNDQCVFESEIYSVAVENCSAEIRGIADEIIGLNTNSSVTEHVLKLIAQQENSADLLRRRLI